ncbi:NUDIX domain-containing protein [Streptomyces sp. BR1]|uniref:NUDIX domain-containing protein n=1 Tax=Streptomyces sp. BR1 TaxID=1592323 RepID=UPI00402B2DB4
MAHADIDQADPPRRRIRAVVLVRNRYGDILMVKPRRGHADRKQGWQLPGGGTHAGEPIAVAAARELLEKTGLKRKLSYLLMVDQVPASADQASAEGINFVLDGGTLDNDEAAAVSLPESAQGELSAVEWVPAGQLDELALPYQAARIRAAARAFEYGMRQPMFLLGELVGS